MSWWLIASYLHCVHGVTIFSQGYRQELSASIAKSWDASTSPTRSHIRRDLLAKGGFTDMAAPAYPVATRIAAKTIAASFLGMTLA